MPSKKSANIDHQRIELDGVAYVIMRESVFGQLCRKAGIAWGGSLAKDAALEPGFGLDRASLSQRLVARRKAVGLSQAALARAAGIRPETLNRIERGHTNPDFRTIRKLVVAINAAEEQAAKVQVSKATK